MFSDEPNFTSNPERYKEQLAEEFDRYHNVSESERLVSLVIGGAIALLGLRRSSLGALLMLVGGSLLYRGMTGHCQLYEAMGRDSKHKYNGHPVAMKPERHEKVEEASWESFPASDPPSWSGGAIT